jgi:hypothetical protein
LSTQAAARTLPVVFTKFCNQIEFISHDGLHYLIDFVRISSKRNIRETATAPRKDAHSTLARPHYQAVLAGPVGGVFLAEK